MTDCVFPDNNKGKTQRRPQRFGVQNRRETRASSAVASRVVAAEARSAKLGARSVVTGTRADNQAAGGEKRAPEAGFALPNAATKSSGASAGLEGKAQLGAGYSPEDGRSE